MRSIRAWVIRFAASLRVERDDADFRDEIDSHLQLHTDDYVRAGMPPDEARRHAILKLGGVAQIREQHRDRRRLPWIDTLRQDLIYAARTLRANPAFTATVVLTLAIGIGATAAIFSAVNAVLLRPLPFRDPERLVMVYAIGRPDDRMDSVSYPTFVDWRTQAQTLESAAAYANSRITISDGTTTEFVRGKRITPSTFGVLGVWPSLGRAFTDADANQPVVILSHGLWQRRFGGSPSVLGQTVRILDLPFTIVGVMPAAFHIDPPDQEQLYAPLPPDPSRGHGFLRVVGRLRQGVSARQAQDELDIITADLRRQYGRSSEANGTNVMPLVDALAGPGRLALLILLAVVSLVLLIACTNVASLLLAQGATRQREMAVRAALGAGRGRLVRQLLTESLVLAIAGGASGLLLADWLARLLVRIVGDFIEVPRLDATRTDGQVLLFTALVAIATGVVFGTVPAISSGSPDLADAMRDAGRSATGSRAPRIRRALVVIETALALILLSGAGVLMKTLITMRSTQPGFNTQNMLAVDLWLPPNRFERLQDRAPFFEQVLVRVRAIPGVSSATFVADLPLNGGTDSEGFHIVGRPDPAPDRWFSSGFNIVTPGYFRMMGIPVREGREFLDADGPVAPGVIVVNQAAARRFWPGESPLGKQIQLPITRQKSVLLTVVGVSADVRHSGLAQPPRSEIFVNSLQTDLNWPSVVLAVRASTNPTDLAEPVKAAFREVNPNVPLSRVSTMDEVIDRSMAEPRLYSWLFLAFAVAAVTLSAVGLYGLISFSVAQRSKELGVRVALGASQPSIVRLVLRQGLGLAATGMAIGLVGGFAATRTLVGLMHGIEPNDPATYLIVTLVLFAVAVAACYVPARRAARLDPLAALRTE